MNDDDEIYYIIQENGVLPHSLRPRVHRRQVARTRMSERIYQQIQEIRRSRFNRRMIILSDSESSSESEYSEVCTFYLVKDVILLQCVMNPFHIQNKS